MVRRIQYQKGDKARAEADTREYRVFPRLEFRHFRGVSWW